MFQSSFKASFVKAHQHVFGPRDNRGVGTVVTPPAPFANARSGSFDGNGVATANNVGNTLVGAAGSIIGWVKPSNRLYFLGLINDGATFNVPFNNSAGIILNVTSSGTRTIQARVYRPSVATVIFSSTQAIASGVWTFFAVAWDGTGADLYVRAAGSPGPPTKTTSPPAGVQAAAISWGGADMCLGSYEQSDLSAAFTGNLDEVATYNKKLSDAEISEIFGDEGLPVALDGLSSSDSLTAWWRFDGPEISQVVDQIGGINLTPNGGVALSSDVPSGV